MELLDVLGRIVGRQHVLTPAPERLTTDWLGRRSGPVAGAIRPGNTAEVAACLLACAEAGCAVIPVGGNTGLVGGTLAPAAADRPILLLSTERLLGIEVDADSATLRCGAGVPLGDVHRAAAAAGWRFGVDLAARDSATVGGAIATNAGGMHVCAYGTMRQQVLGVEAVLGDGSVVTDLAGLPKDNTGFDLRDLLVGSEGCLGIVTRALLQVHPAPGETVVVVAAVPTLAAGVAITRALGGAGRVLAAEFVAAESWIRAAVDLGLRDPLGGRVGGYAVLVELARVDEDLLGAVLADAPDAAVGRQPGERGILWGPRERQSEWWARFGTALHKYDVSVPLVHLDGIVAQLGTVVSGWPGATGFGVFGHLLEGSLHVQVVAPGSVPSGEVLAAVAAAGGSISAEHGIGRDKAPYLPLRRSPAEIQAMRRVKEALDPAGLLNPGAVLA